MIYYDKIKVIGSDSSGRSIAVVSLWVDSASSLPAANAYQSDGFILGMGSEGNCIDSGDKYRLDSSGAWQITQAGTGTYTKAEIDAIVSRIDATEAEDRAALVELVDGGAKSLLNPDDTFTSKSSRGVTVTRTGDVYNFSGTAEDYSNIFININNDTTINNFPAGDYVAVFEQVQNDIKLQVAINGTLVFAGEYGQPLFFSIPEGTTNNWIRFFFVRLVNYDNRNARIMICTKAAWDVSHGFQPYRPSWQEMYNMILALQ